MRKSSQDGRRSVDRGTGRQGIELRNQFRPGCRCRSVKQKATSRVTIDASYPRTLRSQRPQACLETPRARTGRPYRCPQPQAEGPVGEGYKPHDQRARLWGVGRMGSTDEVFEQRGSGTSPEPQRRAWREAVRPRGMRDGDRTYRTPCRTERVPENRCDARRKYSPAITQGKSRMR